jgi:D-alanyl-D-alanine dipeptidase
MRASAVVDRAIVRMEGWRDVTIRECGEALVEVSQRHRVFVSPAYWLRGYESALESVLLRAGALDRVELAAARLPAGLALLVWDGWRPVALQRVLYDDYREEIARSSGRSGSALDSLVEMFVSAPSEEPLHPSPHLTGGAVDLTLATADGTPIDMGGGFDELSARSATAFYDGGASADERVYAERRELLVTAMESAEFTNLPSEWWHFDFGDQFWGHLTQRDAVYGKADASGV